MAILIGFISINLLRPQQKSNLDSSITTLISDLKEQQLKSMVGDSDGKPAAQTYGIYFEPTRYTLFQGNAYDASDTHNFAVSLNDITISTSLPSSQIVFNRRDGELIGFTENQNTLTFKNSSSQNQKIITINKYGTISIE